MMSLLLRREKKLKKKKKTLTRKIKRRQKRTFFCLFVCCEKNRTKSLGFHGKKKFSLFFLLVKKYENYFCKIDLRISDLRKMTYFYFV